MDSIQALSQERDQFIEKAEQLDQAIIILGGKSAFGGMASEKTKRAPPRAPASAAAEGKKRTRVNPMKVDHFVLQALIDGGGFMASRDILGACDAFGFTVTGQQMRDSITRLFGENMAEDNGELKAKKRYRSTVTTNNIEFEAGAQTAKAAKKASSIGSGEETTISSSDEEEDETDESSSDLGNDIAGALDDTGTSGITAGNAIIMALSVAPDGLGLASLVKKALDTFRGQFSEGSLKSAIDALVKDSAIAKKKVGRNNIYTLSPVAG